ncbi:MULTISPECIES: 7-cyano-7-deazaguanine reductase [Porphyromonadaceae]|uniref:7-cyano-7-deazaguanine reductase n=1 Tax=Sanguibacteroides justesenii TaxID=1547597 RepID=A0A0C3R6W0_9PORP|nr:MULTISPECIES: 7-cyano-7-deazaguanine reductase [Porphyromonadaceae]KIO43646.1 7-cyano-7-deazaguanine reductase [Sanguibacteroides justesenii]KIO45810.1 7-cyano-7-deazaguanine reductase [Sanguibacteroides justesenii]PXZ45104.1 NADPH-dependent 7-cyano-7-deazaguanine reductase QueF [Sanguibacteroides justesenii]
MEIEAKVLGQQVAYPTDYCPSILVPVPRSLNREMYDIRQPEELFCGYDTWHAYEAGFITRKGLPVCGVLKIVYPSTSKKLVESKSLKLYLNSFNMARLGENVSEGIRLFTQTVQSDLQELLNTSVQVCFHEKLPDRIPFDFEGYTLLEEIPLNQETEFTEYNEAPALLRQTIQPGGEIKVYSNLLRSNCKITKQPDWGTLYVWIKAQQLPSPVSLLKYIVSLRNENHFHEEICEMTYKRLWDLFHPEILSVSCLYTRRGGIDICPSRANRKEYLPSYLHTPEILTRRNLRQ